MPFTFSHPAVVLPLTYLPKRWISLTGLVIGSMAPDFEYFFRLRVYSSYSHTWSGLFWFDLPLTILLAFVFHLIVRDSLIDNLPKSLYRRLYVFKNFNWPQHFKENFFVVISSILVGAITHIFWDSFTHEHGHFVQRIDVLLSTFSIAGYSIPAYKLLQHTSSLIGGLIIIYALFRLPQTRNQAHKNSISRFWVFVSLIALAIVAGRLLTGLDFRQYGNVIVTMISGGLTGLVLTPRLTARKA